MTDSIDISKKYMKRRTSRNCLDWGDQKPTNFWMRFFKSRNRSVSSRLGNYIEFPVPCLTDGYMGNRKSKV